MAERRYYHLSQSLTLGEALEADHQRLMSLAQPYIEALERGPDCFYGMLLAGKYLFAVLSKSGLREWADWAKWATEGVFEFVRRQSFPEAVSRLGCSYFYADPAQCLRLFREDWGEEVPEERAKVKLFAVETEDPAPDRRDMRLYDEAYDAIREKQDLDGAVALAEWYFRGEASEEPVWELLSDKPARAVEDLSAMLTAEETESQT